MPKKLLIPLLLLAMITVIVSATSATAVTPTAQAEQTMPDQAPPILPDQGDESPFASYDVIVVRAYYTDRAMLNRLAAWNEPWEVNTAAGYAVVEVTAAEYDRLLLEGYRLEVDEKLTALLNRPQVYLPGQVTGIPGYPCYRTVEETFATAEEIVTNYPNLAEWLDAGDSWEKLAPGGLPGYDMMVLKLTNSAIPGPKPAVFIMAAVHAREYTTAELVTRFAEYLVANYGIDADVTWLLDYHEFHLMLQSNPDGRKQAETGLSWRKNTNNNYCANTNTRGADLNRNFAFQWNCCGGSSGSPCDLTYRGPSPASEPEVQAIQNYVRTNFPDQRPDPLTAPAPPDATGIFLDIHSYSELVLWPWGFTSTVAPNGTALQTLGRKFAYFNGYMPQQAIGLYPTDGSTDDFAYGELGLAAYTFELGTAFFQSCGVFENTILPANMPALLYSGKVARTPYLTPAGPDALNVALSESVISPGTAVNLTATMNDTRFSTNNGIEPSQPIAAAEYYINTPPWITTTTPIAYPMAAADGSFNQTIEAVVATVDTTGLAQGRHILYARGRDAAGNWGPVSATFLYVIDPAVAPIITGQVRAADTGQPLEATVTAGSVGNAPTNPATGIYSIRVISGTYNMTAVPASNLYAAATAPNVYAPDYQTVTQNFFLYPYCTIFSDDVESGNLGWTAQTPWAITSEMSYSPTRSWTDSPGGNYANNRNISLTSQPFDLSGYSGVKLDFWQVCDVELNWDYCYVEVSADGGTSWQTVASYTGAQTAWQAISLPLPQLDGAANGRIRFRFFSDGSIVRDGWHLDDIVLSGAGPGCVNIMAPIASFTSSSPDALGQATQFINTSLGTDNSYTWDFGDGSPGSSTENPTYTYAQPGSYTVTLTASNILGSDVTTGTVAILLPPQASFTHAAIVAVGQPVSFSNTSTGDQLAFTWAFGDGGSSNETNPTHAYASSGTYTVTLTASSPVGADSFSSVVTVQQGPTASFTSSSPDALGEVTTFTNTSSGNSLSFAWDFGDGSPISSTENPTHTYTLPGSYVVTLTATNPIHSDIFTATVAILLPPQASFSSNQPVQLGQTMVFTNTSTGDDLSFSWDFGDGSTAVTTTNPIHLYTSAGTYTVTLTVTNPVGVSVSTQQVVVTELPAFRLFLPVIWGEQ